MIENLAGAITLGGGVFLLVLGVSEASRDRVHGWIGIGSGLLLAVVGLAMIWAH